jgi:hypothetical protein
VRKTLIITLATVVLVVLASAAALCTLAAFAGEHGTCGSRTPAELRQAADSAYGAKLTKLARCERLGGVR